MWRRCRTRGARSGSFVEEVAGSIALTSAGFPWLAFALNSAFTSKEAMDGGLTWKQAAVQVGVNAAITYVTAGAGDMVSSTMGSAKSLTTEFAAAAARSAVSTLGSTLASGIEYDKDGTIDWNSDRMSDNKTWSQAGLNFAVSFGASAAMVGMQNKGGLNLNSNLLGTTVSTTINTMGSNFSVEGDGGWDWEGFGNIDGQKAVISGAANYVSSTATGGMRDQYMKALVGGMINAYAQKGASELFERYGGRDFGDAYSLDRAISVDTLSISAQNAYMDTKNRILISNMSENDKKNLSPEQKKQLGLIPDERSVLRKMGEGLVDAGASVLSMGTSFVNEAKAIMSDAERIGDFGESIANVYRYGEFASNESNVIIQKKIAEIMRENRQGGDGDLTDPAYVHSLTVKRLRDLARKILANENSVQRKIIDQKRENGYGYTKDGGYTTEIDGVKVNITAGAVDTRTKAGWLTQEESIALTDTKIFTIVKELGSKVGAKEIQVTSLFRVDGIGGHQDGKGIDITTIKFNDGTRLDYNDTKMDNPIAEPDAAKRMREYFDTKKGIIMDVYTPWQMKRESNGQPDWFKNEWRAPSPTLEQPDINRMKQHNNHLHLRIY